MAKKLDVIIEEGYSENNEDGVVNNSQDSEDIIKNNKISDSLLPHDYDVAVTQESVLEYISGYVVRKGSRFTKCAKCLNSLQANEPSQEFKFINAINQGGLIFPSLTLVELISKLENVVLNIVGKMGIHIETLSQILENLRDIENLPRIGCHLHFKELAKKIINYYVIMRGHFLCKSFHTNN